MSEETATTGTNYVAIEYSFFGCIFESPPLRIPEALTEKAREEWFTEPVCRLMWAAIEELRKKAKLDSIVSLTIVQTAINISRRRKSPYYGVKVTTEFIDEAKRFRESHQETAGKDIAGYAQFLRDATIGRQMEEAFRRSAADAGTGGNAARAAALVRQIQAVQQTESIDTDINVSDLLDNMTASYDKAYVEYKVNHNYNYIPGIPYPWEDVAHLTKGLNPGLHVIAARPSVGKTSYILQCMVYWCNLGYKVAFDCLDMSVTEMIKRPVANLAWVSPTRMEFGWASPEEQLRNREATEKVRGMFQNGLFTVTLEPDVDKLKAWAEIRHAAGKLDILVIDFAQRFRVKGATSEYEIVTYVAGVLKQLANECLMPVILLSQLSRDNVKAKDGPRPPELSDLRGSGALEQDATSVVLLHKPFDINTTWKGEPPYDFAPIGRDKLAKEQLEIAEAIAAVNWNLAKNQNGPTGEIPFVVYQHCFRWYVGDRRAAKADRYSVIKADWRFNEEPFLTVAANGKAIYPNYWEQKCAEVCGKMGIPIPDNIRPQLKQWDIDRYEKLLGEHQKRMESARIASGISADAIRAGETPPPTISKMAAVERQTQEENLQGNPTTSTLIMSTTAEESSPMPDDDFENGPW